MQSDTQNYSIVASDLDGTLLGPDHTLSDFTKATLKSLHQKSYTFAFATGRHHVDVRGIKEITGIPAFMITANGARVYTPDNELLFQRNVPEHLIQPIIELLRHEQDMYIHMYRNDSWLLSQEDEVLRAFHKESGFTFSVFDATSAPTSGVFKVFFTHPSQNHEMLAEYEAKLNAMFKDEITVAFSTPWCLEVMGAKVSKGYALEKVAESLGKTLDDCIAFGDGMNDIEMLTMAHKGLVMETAHEKVLSALPEITRIGSCADDAVAHYLQDYLF